MVDIVKTKAAFDAKAAFVGGAVDPFDEFDFAVFNFQRNLAADAAERADAVGFAVKISAVADLVFVCNCGGHQRACWAGLHAFATGHARAVAHRVIHVENRVGIVAATSHADDVIDLYFTASAHAKAALNAGVKVDRHRDMRRVQQWHKIRL